MAGHTGQTLNDRLNAARYALAGQGLARVVCKATTEEVIGPKKKHLDYLLQCTHEPNVSIPQLANLLIERTNHSSWVVVFKALVTVHQLMCYGNERFTQYLASSNCTFQLSNFLDKNGVKGYEMSTFIRRYAKYLNEKALSYRTVAFDFTKIKRGKEEGSLRSMNTDKLIKTIPTLQSQVDSLLEFDCTANDLTNGVINAAFMLLFRDLIRLFACYNDGIINCLEKYFDMNKKHAREALDIYKKFLIRMDKVAEFLKVAENVGIDKGEIPDLTKAPSSLLDALEQHLAQLEGKKGQTTNTNSVPTNGTTSNGSIPNDSFNGVIKEESSVKKALEEEEQMLHKLKSDSIDRTDSNSPFVWKQENWLDLEKHLQEQDKKPNNPFLSMSPTAETKSEPTSESKSQGILDLFNDNQNSNSAANNQSGKASDDLLCLSNANPFADILNAAMSSAPPTQSAFPSMTQQNMAPILQNAQSFNNGLTNSTTNGNNMFASDDGFAAAFGKTDTTSNSEGTVVAEEADQFTSTLPIPSTDDQTNRSISPSPTHEVIRGAGTTPILPIPPDSCFGEDSGIDESNISRGNSPSPAIISAPPPSGENSPFGTPFENSPFSATLGGSSDQIKLPPPARPPPPPHEKGTFAPPSRPPPPSAAVKHDIDSDLPPEEDNFGESLQSTGPPPPRPPAPGAVINPTFAGNQQQFIIQQQLMFQQQQALAAQQLQQQQQPQQQSQQPSAPKKAASAFEDLDLAMRQTMAKPQQPAAPVATAPLTQGAVFVPPGTIPPAGYVVMPSYGVPVGAAGFDAFGDVLQPQQLGNKTGQTIQTAPTPVTTSNSNQSLFKGDLDSSLASLAQNLDINGPKGAFKKPGQQQWSSPKNNVKTGAPVQAQPGWPANQPMNWNSGTIPISAQQPAMVPTGGQWSASPVPPMMVSANSMPMTYGVQMRPAMGGMPGAVPVLPVAMPVIPTSTAPRPVNPGLASPQSDPFGAL